MQLIDAWFVAAAAAAATKLQRHRTPRGALMRRQGLVHESQGHHPATCLDRHANLQVPICVHAVVMKLPAFDVAFRNRNRRPSIGPSELAADSESLYESMVDAQFDFVLVFHADNGPAARQLPFHHDLEDVLAVEWKRVASGKAAM